MNKESNEIVKVWKENNNISSFWKLKSAVASEQVCWEYIESYILGKAAVKFRSFKQLCLFPLFGKILKIVTISPGQLCPKV